MSEKFFAVISRMKYIDRWALMRNTISENISEHSLETAFIAHALALLRNRRFGGNINAERCALLAMYSASSSGRPADPCKILQS